RYRVGGAARIGEEVLQFAALIRRPVPHHVVAAMARAQVIVGAGDRIAQTLLARRQAEGHVVEQLAMDCRCKRRLGNERAPRHVAGVKRRQLRQALLADGGAKAIRTHQELGLRRIAVAEMRDHGVFSLHETADASTTVVALARERVPQSPVDPLPGGENLGTCDLAGQPAGRIQDLTGRDLDPSAVGSIPSRRSVSIRSGCATMPAPRPASSLSTRSKTSTSQPARRSSNAANRPLMEPPTISARRLLAFSLDPAISCRAQVAIYRAKPGGMPWP